MEVRPVADVIEFNLVVCRRIMEGLAHFADDEFGTCQRCHAAIRFRPNPPNGPKVCLQCARVLVGEAAG
jgi:hypothetical protein